MAKYKNIEERQTEYGTVYRARITYKKKTYRATRDRLGDAVNWIESTKALLREGKVLPGDIPTGDMTLGDATNKFIGTAVGVSPSTKSGYIYAQTQLLKYFGEKALLSEITPLRMTEFVDQRRLVDMVGASKIYQELSFVRGVYTKAASWGVNIPSPELTIKRPKRSNLSNEDRLDRVIKPDEMIALLDTVAKKRPDLYYYLLFLLYTGMRPSEAACLRWERGSSKEEKKARFEKRHIGHLALNRVGFGHIGTKTGTRYVPAHPVVLKIIKQLKKERSKDSLFVFLPNDHGQRDRPYQYYRWAFRTCKSEAKLESGAKIRDNIDFYSFRHTARSMMAKCRVQDSAAEEILGHDGKNTMQRTYTHYEDEDLVKEISLLEYPWLDIQWGKI